MLCDWDFDWRGLDFGVVFVLFRTSGMRTNQVVCNQLENQLGSARVVSKRV